MAALLAGLRPDVDDPVGVADHVERVFDHEQRIAGRLEPRQRPQQRFGIGRMQAGRRFVEHIDHAEQTGTHLGAQPQPLQLAGRQRRRAAVQAQIAQSEVEQHVQPRHHVLRDAPRDDGFFGMASGRPAAVSTLLALLARLRVRPQQLRQPPQGQLRDGADIEAGEGHRQRFGPQALAVAARAPGADHVLRDALFHRRALGAGIRLQHIFSGAGEGALIARRLLALQRAAGGGRIEAGVDRHRRLLVGEQDPVALLLRQRAPRQVDVVTERDEDVAQVLAVPRGRPCGDGALADGQRIVRHHRALRHFVDPAQSMAMRAGALRRVRRKRFGVQQFLPGRIVAGARIQHAQRIGQGADAADRGARGRRAALLLQGHRRRQAVDGAHLRHRHLVEQPARIRRHRFQIAPLRLGVQRAEGQRRFAGAGHAGEHHQRVARDVDVDILQVVDARAAHADTAFAAGGAGGIGGKNGRRGHGAGVGHGVVLDEMWCQHRRRRQ